MSIMNFMMSSKIFLKVLTSFFMFQLFLVEVNTSRQVTLSCGSDQESQRGLPGYPGKQGPKGANGDIGPKGSRGLKGDPGQCPDVCAVALNRISSLEADLNDFKECLHRCVNGRCINQNNTYVCLCYPGYTGTNCIKVSDCYGVSRAGYTSNGVYNITVPGRTNPVQVYCDLNTDDGGWLLFQRRINGSVDFYRNWTEYEHGFGNLNGEFWLGLDLLHEIIESKFYQLRVDLEDWEGNTVHAVYRNFSIGNSQSNYQLRVDGYNGTAGDSLSYHNNQEFSTKDRDNDAWGHHCAQHYHGAWWYNLCRRSNLNGEYLRNGEINYRGVVWSQWKNNYYSMKRTEMKIKPN